MANITVKKNDGTTDIVWTALTPAAGDDSPALWRSETVSAVNAFKPRLELKSRWTQDKKSLHVEGYVVYPVTQTDTGAGLTTLIGQIPINVKAVLPQQYDAAIINEAVSQAMNLFASTLAKDSFKAGFAPN
jgi:hypothetical protein